MYFLVLYRKTLPTLAQSSAVLSVACGPIALAGLGAIRIWNLVSTPDPLNQNLQIPGESSSQYSLRSAGLKALLTSSCGCTLPQVQAAREDQGVWPSGAPTHLGRALSIWTLASLLPTPVPPSLCPCPSPVGGQDTAVYGWKEVA